MKKTLKIFSLLIILQGCMVYDIHNKRDNNINFTLGLKNFDSITFYEHFLNSATKPTWQRKASVANIKKDTIDNETVFSFQILNKRFLRTTSLFLHTIYHVDTTKQEPTIMTLSFIKNSSTSNRDTIFRIENSHVNVDSFHYIFLRSLLVRKYHEYEIK